MAGHNNGTRKENKGRCKRCAFSYQESSEPWRCIKYGKPCVRVAWNCVAPPEGYTTYFNA